MRKVSTLILATLLIAGAFATGEQLEKPTLDMVAAHPEAKKTVMHAARMVMEHFSQMHSHNAFAGITMNAAKTLIEPRNFDAKADSTPAPTCDQEGYSAAQVVVLQACPSLSGLISGTVALTDFLPGFCGSNCYKVIAANLPKYGVCLDASTKPLVTFVDGCVSHPECYGETALKSGLALTAACGSGSNALFNFYNSTTAAKSDITNFCTNCLTAEKAYISAYPRCVAADATAAAGINKAMDVMCSRTGGTTGDYCAWNLRSVGNIDCTNNCQASPWCDNSCSLVMSSANLDSMCGNTCLSGLASVATAIGADKVLLTSLNDLFCSKAPNSTAYCYATAQTALATYNPTSSAAMATTCTGNSGICLSNFFALSASLAAASARSTFTTCASKLSKTYSSLLYTYCQSSLETGLRSAEKLRTTSAILCATNADGGYCMPSAYTFLLSPCFNTAVGGSCSSSCATTLSGYASTAGCCLPLINDYLKPQSTRYWASYLPAGTFSAALSDGTNVAYTFDPDYAVANPDRSLQPLNALAVCSNTTDLWTSIESGCPASSNAVSRSFSVRMSFAAATVNLATKTRILSALIADAAIAAKLAPSLIRNATISADTSISVTTSRRASTSGIKFSFVIDGASASDIATAASSFDTTAKSGITTANTGAAAASCTGCLPAGQDGSALTSGSSGGSSGSASSVTVAVAAVAALASLFM